METLASAQRTIVRFSKISLHKPRLSSAIGRFVIRYLFFLVLIKLNEFFMNLLELSPFGYEKVYSSYDGGNVIRFNTGISITPDALIPSTRQLMTALTFSLLFSAVIPLIGRLSPRLLTHLLPKSWWMHDPDEDSSKELRDAFADEIRYSETEAMVSNRLHAIQAIDDRIKITVMAVAIR